MIKMDYKELMLQGCSDGTCLFARMTQDVASYGDISAEAKAVFDAIDRYSSKASSIYEKAKVEGKL